MWYLTKQKMRNLHKARYSVTSWSPFSLIQNIESDKPENHEWASHFRKTNSTISYRGERHYKLLEAPHTKIWGGGGNASSSNMGVKILLNYFGQQSCPRDSRKGLLKFYITSYYWLIKLFVLIHTLYNILCYAILFSYPLLIVY